MLQSSARVYALVLCAAVLLLAVLTSLLHRAQSCGCEQTYMYSSYTDVPVLDPKWSHHRYRCAHKQWHACERGGAGQLGPAKHWGWLKEISVSDMSSTDHHMADNVL
jgi:hypothetical protein